MENNLVIKDLSINIHKKNILQNINLSFKTGDLIAIIGPNGAGKSTLLKALMHHYLITVTKGEIKFNGENIKNLPTFKIAKKGFFYADQSPIELEGVPMLEFLKDIIKVNNPNSNFANDFQKINAAFNTLSLDKSLLDHYVNVGFSGGQKKKNEIVQSLLLNSKVILLDEIDAGLDIDALKIIEKHIQKTRKDYITIMVSHDLDIFKRLKPNKVVLIANKKIVKTGDISLVNEIIKNGYSKYEQKKIIKDPFKI